MASYLTRSLHRRSLRRPWGSRARHLEQGTIARDGRPLYGAARGGVPAWIGAPGKRGRSGRASGKHRPALGHAADARNTGRPLALERGCTRDGDPLARPRNAILQTQSAPDSPLRAGPTKFVFPAQPILIIDFPLPTQGPHSGNFRAVINALAGRRSGGSPRSRARCSWLARTTLLAEKPSEKVD